MARPSTAGVPCTSSVMPRQSRLLRAMPASRRPRRSPARPRSQRRGVPHRLWEPSCTQVAASRRRPLPVPRRARRAHAGAPSASHAASRAPKITNPISSAMKMSRSSPLVAMRANGAEKRNAAGDGERHGDAGLPQHSEHGLEGMAARGGAVAIAPRPMTRTAPAVAPIAVPRRQCAARPPKARQKPCARSPAERLQEHPSLGRPARSLLSAARAPATLIAMPLPAGGLGAAPKRLRAGRAHDHSLMAGSLGAAPEGLRADGTGRRAALTGCFQALDGGIARPAPSARADSCAARGSSCARTRATRNRPCACASRTCGLRGRCPRNGCAPRSCSAGRRGCKEMMASLWLPHRAGAQAAAQ